MAPSVVGRRAAGNLPSVCSTCLPLHPAASTASAKPERTDRNLIASLVREIEERVPRPRGRGDSRVVSYSSPLREAGRGIRERSYLGLRRNLRVVPSVTVMPTLPVASRRVRQLDDLVEGFRPPQSALVMILSGVGLDREIRRARGAGSIDPDAVVRERRGERLVARGVGLRRVGEDLNRTVSSASKMARLASNSGMYLFHVAMSAFALYSSFAAPPGCLVGMSKVEFSAMFTARSTHSIDLSYRPRAAGRKSTVARRAAA